MINIPIEADGRLFGRVYLVLGPVAGGRRPSAGKSMAVCLWAQGPIVYRVFENGRNLAFCSRKAAAFSWVKVSAGGEKRVAE